MTKEQAYNEIELCRANVKYWKEWFNATYEFRGHHIYYKVPVSEINKAGKLIAYNKDKLNKLKQKYFFTEKV